jgi:hypothetical protein
MTLCDALCDNILVRVNEVIKFSLFPIISQQCGVLFCMYILLYRVVFVRFLPLFPLSLRLTLLIVSLNTTMLIPEHAARTLDTVFYPT